MSYKFLGDLNTSDLEELKDKLETEFTEVERAFTSLSSLTLQETHVAPAKPREGNIYFADGTNWNPGSGKGIYAYYSGSWNKL
jgi:hypothetical protein